MTSNRSLYMVQLGIEIELKKGVKPVSKRGNENDEIPIQIQSVAISPGYTIVETYQEPQNLSPVIYRRIAPDVDNNNIKIENQVQYDQNIGQEGSGAEYTEKEETGTVDMGTEYSGKEDTGTEDTEKEDSEKEDTEKEDSGKEDTGTVGTGTEDLEREDSGAEDSGTEDSGKEESGKEDSGKEDSGAEDSGAEVSGEEATENENAENLAEKSTKKKNYPLKLSINLNNEFRDIKMNIRDHINLFPRVESHYIRKDSKRQYLQADVQSIAQMYSLYKEWMSEHNDNQVGTYNQYRKIFNDDFNVGFFMPKKDQCDLCDSLKLASGEEKEKLMEKIEEHQRNKLEVRRLKEEDKARAKGNSTVVVACYDLEKVLISPFREISTFYYKLKYSTYNFTVYDIGNAEGFCYVWHETLAKRGVNEIGSCVLKFIEGMIEQGKKEFIFYTDNCAGQNKNRFMYALYAFILKKHHNIVSITHRFLEKGHTQNEGDSMHALIERAKKGKEIMTPDQWVMLIKMAKRTGQPYKVNEISQDDVFNVKLILNEKENWNLDTNKTKIKWTEIKELKIEKDTPNKIYIRYNFAREDFVILDTASKSRASTVTNAPAQSLVKAYNGLIPITKKTYDHLQFLCRNIPKAYHDFYKNLPYTNNRSAEDSE